MAYQLSKINEAIRSDTKGFLEECDAEFQRKVDRAAEKIIENLPQSPIVLLSGPSGSGKTTTAMNNGEVSVSSSVFSRILESE